MTSSTRTTSKQKHQRPKFIALGLLSVFALCFVVVYRNAFATSFILATTMQPEQYTALYVDNSTKLPQYAPTGKTQQMTFHIANHEGQTTTYTYAASLQVSSKTTVIGSQSVTLHDGDVSTNTISFKMTKANTDATITINLVGRTEYLIVRTRS